MIGTFVYIYIFFECFDYVLYLVMLTFINTKYKHIYKAFED